MRKSLCIFVGLLLAVNVSAGIVLWSDSEEFHFGGGYYGQAQFSWSLVGEGETIDDSYYAYAYCEFHISQNEQLAYRPDWHILHGGVNVLRINEGDPVDHSTTFGTDKTYYYGELQSGSTEAPLELSMDEPLLLGFATANEGDKSYGDYIYGWIRLIFDGENLRLDSSAVAIGTDVAGIYAGTGIIIPRQVPEPSIPILAIIGIVALMLRREVKANP
jgi:hypothetical protein